MTDVDYAYRWEEPVGVCAHPLEKQNGPTYCTAPIKYTTNDYATWGTGSSGMNPLLAAAEDSPQHETCAELSTGQALVKPSHCLPSGADSFHLDLGYGPCATSSTIDTSCDVDAGDHDLSHDLRADVDDIRFSSNRFGSTDLCRVEEESEGAEETDELTQQGPDVQNRLNNILQDMSSTAT